MTKLLFHLMVLFLFPPLFSLDHFDTSNPNLDDVVISLDDCFPTSNVSKVQQNDNVR
jgi:hypothetical protein